MRIKEALAVQRIRRDADTAFFARAFAQEPPFKGRLSQGRRQTLWPALYPRNPARRGRQGYWPIIPRWSLAACSQMLHRRGHWVGRPDESTHFPAVLTIDWIRAYRRATGTVGSRPSPFRSHHNPLVLN
jgi:hypothetical protein